MRTRLELMLCGRVGYKHKQHMRVKCTSARRTGGQHSSSSVSQEPLRQSDTATATATSKEYIDGCLDDSSDSEGERREQSSDDHSVR